MSEKPWDLIENNCEDDDLIESAWAETKAEEYLFDVRPWPEDEDGGPMITIVPVAYFNKHNAVFDQHLQLDHILGDDYFQEMESTFVSDLSEKVFDVRQDLLKRGLREDPRLTKLLDDCHVSDEDEDEDDHDCEDC